MKKRNLFRWGKTPQENPAPQVTPAMEAKRDYAAVYIKRNEMKKRQCVYISYDIHDIISRLVRQLANQGHEVTVGGYIDTVLKEHLQANREEINEVYRRCDGNLF